jgi:uncharacterized repeat protein (TIGR02543 family)
MSDSQNSMFVAAAPAAGPGSLQAASRRSLRAVRSQSRYGWWVALATVLLVMLGWPDFAAAQSGIIFVTSLEQKINGTGGCSLQEAIYSADFHISVDGVHGIAIDSVNPDGTDHVITTSCVAGTGDDIIMLPTGAAFHMSNIVDDAHNPLGPTATPIIFSKITIEANGSTLQWGGQRNARAFAVGNASINLNFGGTNYTFSGTGNVTIRNAYIKSFVAKGGDGANGGGGGLGAGGAIYVKDASLTIENSTFAGNAAVGGNGSTVLLDSGGGGGGLGGNGGSSEAICGTIFCDFQGGGGGGGSRGNGGAGNVDDFLGGFGGQGGGTVRSGGGGSIVLGGVIVQPATGGDGFQCGANGGSRSGFGGGADGDDAECSGGGGGGGQSFQPVIGLVGSGNGGKGAFGGGGGGGGFDGGDGGDGGFGGGGGGGSTSGGSFGPIGGNGGFGGGGGAAAGGSISGGPGQGGTFGGKASTQYGGGGGALGGAIFNDGGGIVVNNSTFTGNFVVRGIAGNAPADNGGDAGGAIFSLNGHLRIFNATISGNQSTGSGGGVVMLQTFGIPLPDALFILDNTIIFNNGAMDTSGNLTSAQNECSSTGPSIAGDGAGNLIQNNDNCPGVVTSNDPQLAPLQPNGGNTPTMAITSAASAAFGTADAATSLPTDQRAIARPQFQGFDIGAYQACSSRFVIIVCPFPNAPPGNTEQLTIQVSPAVGGTTNPAAGSYSEPLNSVVVLTAMPKQGYFFSGWTGAVADSNSALTTVTMNQPQTVTAKFGGPIGIVRGGFVLNMSTGRYAQTVTLTNNSGATITGPISLVLDSLSSNATLFNATGTTSLLAPPAGSPYINANINLAAGQSVPIALQFTDPTKTAITYTTRVVAGPVSR